MAQAQIGTDPHEKTRLELEQKFAKEHSKAATKNCSPTLGGKRRSWADCPKKLT